MKKFKEPLTTAVFTTKFVLENGSAIVYVYHDDDGDWQFHGAEDNVSDSDMRVVGLCEIISMDKSILQIADLPLGFEAMRKDKQDDWSIVSPN